MAKTVRLWAVQASVMPSMPKDVGTYNMSDESYDEHIHFGEIAQTLVEFDTNHYAKRQFMKMMGEGSIVNYRGPVQHIMTPVNFVSLCAEQDESAMKMMGY